MLQKGQGWSNLVEKCRRCCCPPVANQSLRCNISSWAHKEVVRGRKEISPVACRNSLTRRGCTDSPLSSLIRGNLFRQFRKGGIDAIMLLALMGSLAPKYVNKLWQPCVRRNKAQNPSTNNILIPSRKEATEQIEPFSLSLLKKRRWM